MLASLPSVSPPPPPRLKRGGQPGNANAFKHGLYSGRSHHPHLPLFRLAHKPAALPILPKEASLPDWIAALNQVVEANRLYLTEITALTSSCSSIAEICACALAASSVVGPQVKALKSLYKLGGMQNHLRSLVEDLPALVNWELIRHKIPEKPAFVPQEFYNFHANLEWKFPHLTAPQWLLLEEILRCLHAELDSSRKYRRRKPLPSGRLLLEGILYKLAIGLRWQDLEGKFPVRACQELYRALYNSGYMEAIYNQLKWLLDAHGEASLDELVERGCFFLSRNGVCLSFSEEMTWEKYTALLLLQQGFKARRALERKRP